ncbi:MAG: DUF4276 family protein [Muribaculaceae bacterium]|nr:DUF4276 family protein [Muribaculaceae bacterium]
MKNCILTILCEGPTESNFASKVLGPFFCTHSIYVKTVILTTSRKKGATGGMISHQQAINDLARIFATIRSNHSETNIVTTMFDLYALPNDFTDYAEAMRQKDARTKVDILEQALGAEIGRRNFIPYIQLHEFEALLFSDIMVLQIDYPDVSRNIEKLKAQTDLIGDPELINHNPETAPSKRIINTLHPKYQYNKVRSGVSITSAITLPVIMDKCAHFNDWINQIIHLSNQLEYEKNSHKQ